MGAGKSTIAKELTKHLQLEEIDMDALIVAQSGRSSDTEIFAKDGEVVFRELEIQVAKDLQKRDNGIIATGGGVVMNTLTMHYLKTEGTTVIYLKHAFATAEKRLQGNRIPPLFRDREKARALYKLREPLYAYYADMTIETDHKRPDMVTDEIIAIVAKD